jgi:hypothetical protein
MRTEQGQEARERYLADKDIVRRALIRQLNAGTDVGEFLVAAVCAAERQLDTETQAYRTLTGNRPGSWEAALLQRMIDAGGDYA